MTVTIALAWEAEERILAQFEALSLALSLFLSFNCTE
jgi:hypothetical protein